MNKNSGFSLFEMLVAVGIFASFIAVYVNSQGYNIQDSVQMNNELVLKNLCQLKMNEIISNPPKFSQSLTLAPQTGTFEEYGDYDYRIEYKQLTIPDFGELVSRTESDEQEESQTGRYEKIMYRQLKDNIEKLIWQIRVTVIEKATGVEFELSTWMSDQNAKVQIQI